jgi:metal-sulfur cluster biosynthetic enzyme
MNTQDIHTNMLCQYQEWMDQAEQRLEDIQETADANIELLASPQAAWGRSPQGKYHYLLLYFNVKFCLISLK